MEERENNSAFSRRKSNRTWPHHPNDIRGKSQKSGKPHFMVPRTNYGHRKSGMINAPSSFWAAAEEGEVLSLHHLTSYRIFPQKEEIFGGASWERVQFALVLMSCIESSSANPLFPSPLSPYISQRVRGKGGGKKPWEEGEDLFACCFCEAARSREGRMNGGTKFTKE